MYPIKKPRIILFRLEKDGVYRKNRTFADEQELAKFLVQYEHPITNWDGVAIPGLFQNDYVDFQAVSGEQYRKSIQYASSESGDLYKEVEEIWHPRLYIFCWDVDGLPVYDVRNLMPDIRKIFYAEQKRKPKRKSRAEYQAEWLARRRQKQGRARHTTGTIRRNTFHLEGLKREAGLYCDRPCFETLEDEELELHLAEADYRRFVKPGVLAKKTMWIDEDCCGRSGTGWKDNPGSKYRKQWERKAERNAQLLKKDGIDGGVQKTKTKKARPAEELEEEIVMLRKELVKKKKKEMPSKRKARRTAKKRYAPNG